jgi:hypothetical protein
VIEIEFIEFKSFTTRLTELAKEHAEDVLVSIQTDLIKNPERGTRVKGLGGIRKARAEDPRRGKGKRGGFRYMYYYIESDKQIFLMAIFSKDEQEDLNKEQKKALRKAVDSLKGAGR